MIGDACNLVPTTYANGQPVDDEDWMIVSEELLRSEMDGRSAIAYAKARIEELRREREKTD